MKKPILLAAMIAAVAPAVAIASQAVPDGMQAPAADNPDPPGGYQPAQPLFSTPPVPGQRVIFVPNTMTPDQAYPAPPPLAEYPPCKPGQFDNCMQRRSPK